MAVLASILADSLAKLTQRVTGAGNITVDMIHRIYDSETNAIRISNGSSSSATAYAVFRFANLPLTSGAIYTVKAVGSNIQYSNCMRMFIESPRGQIAIADPCDHAAWPAFDTKSLDFTATSDECNYIDVVIGLRASSGSGEWILTISGVYIEEKGTNANFYVDLATDPSNYVILDNGLKCFHIDQNIGTIYPKGVYVGWTQLPPAINNKTGRPEGTMFGHPEWSSRVAFLKNGEWTGTKVGYTTSDPVTAEITLHEWPTGAWEEVNNYALGQIPYTLPVVYKTGTVTSSHFYSHVNNKVYDYQGEGTTETFTADSRTAPTGVTEDPEAVVTGDIFAAPGSEIPAIPSSYPTGTKKVEWGKKA